MRKWTLQEWFWSWKLFGFGVVNYHNARGWEYDELEIQIGFVRLCFLSSTQMDEVE